MKKIKILLSLVILPILLGFIYDKLFRYAGNWLEDYQNYFKIGFLVLSIISTAWLALISKKDKSWVWLVVSLILLVLLFVYTLFALVIINSSY